MLEGPAPLSLGKARACCSGRRSGQGCWGRCPAAPARDQGRLRPGHGLRAGQPPQPRCLKPGLPGPPCNHRGARKPLRPVRSSRSAARPASPARPHRSSHRWSTAPPRSHLPLKKGVVRAAEHVGKARNHQPGQGPDRPPNTGKGQVAPKRLAAEAAQAWGGRGGRVGGHRGLPSVQ